MKTWWKIGGWEFLGLLVLAVMTRLVPLLSSGGHGEAGLLRVADPQMLGWCAVVREEERVRRANPGGRPWRGGGDSLDRRGDYLPKLQAGQRIDLNKADTLELTRLRGVGRVMARRIWDYRQRLGGFASYHQLLEVYGLDSVTQEVMLRYLYLDPKSVRILDLNKADVEVLSDHPYVGWSLAKRLVAYRRQHGPYHSMKDLQPMLGVDSLQWQRLRPYLDLKD
jgi:DNA uptake protein ComE-like DNA-binding protein